MRALSLSLCLRLRASPLALVGYSAQATILTAELKSLSDIQSEDSLFSSLARTAVSCFMQF